MPYAENDHGVGGDPVADDVRADRDKLAHPRARHGAAPMREICQTIAGRKERFRKADRRMRVEIRQIIVRTPDAAERGLSPDNPHGSRRRRRDSLALDQPHQPLARAFMRDDATGLHIRFRGGIGAIFRRFIGRQIKN